MSQEDKRRPARNAVAKTYLPPSVSREVHVVALERFEDGDVRGGVDALLAADEARPAPCDRRCPRCTFSGPAGLLEFHLLAAHGIDDWDLVEELVRRAA